MIAARSRLSLEPIGPDNLADVAVLLQARNRTRADYVEWKYGRDDGNFRGMVAQRGGRPAGCLGLVPRDLEGPDGAVVPAGWFADWFVPDAERGRGTGAALLAEIARGYPVIFGHPTPPRARRLCLAGGFRVLAAPSCRRLVIRPLEYRLARTRLRAKALLGAAGDRISALASRIQAHFPLSVGGGRAWAFAEAEAHGRWVASQPVRSSVARTAATWRGDGLEVAYFHECPDGGVPRRRLLASSGPGRTSPRAWSRFASEAKDEGCVFVDLFTTEPRLDRAWMALGAVARPVAPILTSAPRGAIGRPDLQGWDVEDWTFLAAED